MAHSLIISSSYTDVAIAHAKDGVITKSHHINKKDANRLLITTIEMVLKQADCNLNSLDYITANSGPSPFTTLRVTLTTVNGIAYATNLPLVGIDALQALLQVYDHSKGPFLVLFNAYGGDAYFALKTHDSSLTQTGCAPVEQILKTVSQNNATVTVIGNGCTVFHDILLDTPWSEQFICDTEAPTYPPIEALAHIGYQQFCQGTTHSMLLPLYLKQPKAYTNR